MGSSGTAQVFVRAALGLGCLLVAIAGVTASVLDAAEQHLQPRLNFTLASVTNQTGATGNGMPDCHTGTAPSSLTPLSDLVQPPPAVNGRGNSLLVASTLAAYGGPNGVEVAHCGLYVGEVSKEPQLISS
jgi:hypothetical protein